MSNAYLFVFSPSASDVASVTQFFDEMDGVDDWFYSIPNSIFLVGTVSARELSKRFMERFGEHRHFVTIISKKARSGWLPKSHWPRLDKADGV